MVTQQFGNSDFSASILGQLDELERFARFVKDNPDKARWPQLELENEFLEERTRELSNGTLPAIIVGGSELENVLERNQLLHGRLQMLKTVRARDGRTVGEALAGRTEFGGGFLFPAVTDAFENDPSSNAALFAFDALAFRAQ